MDGRSTGGMSSHCSHTVAEALRVLEDLAGSCYGPCGRAKMVRANEEASALMVTTTSHRLFAALRLPEPIAQVVLELLASRQARGADSGLFTILLATGLVRGAASSGLPAHVLTTLLPEALRCCTRHLRRSIAVAPLRLSSLQSLIALGWARDAALLALLRTGWQLTEAADLLCKGA